MFSAFTPLPWQHGLLADLAGDPFPAEVRGLLGTRTWQPVSQADTAFGFVAAGVAELQTDTFSAALPSGHYFSAPGAFRLTGLRDDTRVLWVTRQGYRGFGSLGGPIEGTGRLRYIDGCTDSLLIPPVVYGDPCLNLLHIPAGTRQSQHTHPSFRSGLIVSGHGRCVTPEGAAILEPGLPFLIPAHARHSFHTDAHDLLVIAFHPDSDFGPTDAVHPMVNRTLLELP